MVLGPCAHPNCKLRAKFERGAEIKSCNTFVKIWHSKEGYKPCCNVMHKECYEHVKEYLLDRIRRHSTTISDRDIYKLMFVTSRNGKYDMIRKECQCECGGLFGVEVDSQGNPCLVGDDAMTNPPSSDKKKKKQSPKHRNDVSIDLWKQKFEQEDFVEEGCEQYIWKDDQVKLVEETSSSSPTYEYEKDCHPDLPFTACLPPPKKTNVTKNTKTQIQIRVTDEKDFHLISLPTEGVNIWKPSFIGYNGRNLKQLERYNNCSISIQDYYGGVRIFVRGNASNRSTCCKVAEQRIRKALEAHSNS